MKIQVSAQCATLVKDETLVEKSEKLYIVEFLFGESWTGSAKTAIFQAGNVSKTVPLTDDRCLVPAECLETAGIYLKVGVRKDDDPSHIFWCITSKILGKANIDQVTPPTPGGDVMALILEVIRENTATDEEVKAAINDAFGRDVPIDPEDPEHPDNTATDEEVDEMLDSIFGPD